MRFLPLLFFLLESASVLGQNEESKISERLSKEFKAGTRHAVLSKSDSVYNKVEKESLYGPHSHKENINDREKESSPFRLPVVDRDNLLAAPARKAETSIVCLKNHMIVTFEFSTNFNGYIYPHDQFPNCILFKGHQSRRAEMDLAQGPCGNNLITGEDDPEFQPIIEHRLMIQWEKDFVCVDDSSIIVRCDHPDSFNKTISWNFTTLELSTEIERGRHPGPTMFMDIQEGEGPTAPSLSHRVYIGDVLTLVFALSDDVFWFDSNMLSCSAVNGGGQVTQLDPYGKVPLVSYTGVLPVIEDGCSLKPKIFSHFIKEKLEKDGNLVTLHYALFKAFRFPTSNKILIQCDVQICYKRCTELPKCELGFHPRQAQQREKRSAVDPSEPTEPNKIELFKKTIEIWAPEDYSFAGLPPNSLKISTVDFAEQAAQNNDVQCFGNVKFYTWVGISSGIIVILLIFIMIITRSKNQIRCNK